MTAPSAAHLPLSARSLAVRPPGSRLRRRLRGMAAVVLLAAATGCVTVHGASALVPATDKAGAQKALRHFVQVSNEANTKLDPALNSGVETGALSAIDGAGIKAKHIKAPAGDPGYQPLMLSDTRFLIPRSARLAQVVRGGQRRQPGPGPLAAGVHPLQRGPAVEGRVSGGGAPGATARLRHRLRTAYAEPGPAAPVPACSSSRVNWATGTPRTSGRAARVRPLFADGPYTSQVLNQRRTDYAPGPRIITAFADSPADPGGDPTVALRLKDGGAMVFFSTEHRVTQTSNSGGLTVSDPFIKALMTGTPNTSVVLFRAAEQAVSVPARNAGTGGRVTFLAHIDGVVSAHGP